MSRSVGRAIGLDVHRDFCEVAIAEGGVVRSAGRIKTTPEQLELFAQSLGPDDRVALEVTGGAWEIARILERYVRRVVVVSPDETGIRLARAKNDRLDARTLARLLWAGDLDAVWMPDERCRVMRRRLARREQLVRSRARAKNEIHAVLMRRLQGKPPMSDVFGVKGRKWLRGLELPVEESETLQSALRHIEFLDSEIAAVERLIARAALGSPHARRLVDRARRERDLRRDIPGRGRRHPPLPHVVSARRVPRPGSTRAPVRQRTGQGRPDLQARIVLGALGAGRGGLVGDPATRSAARLLPAHPRPPRPRQGRRCGRAQARGAVLVFARPRPGLRPPAALADRQKLRRAEITAGAPTQRGKQTGVFATRERMRAAERELAQQAEASYTRMVSDWQAARPPKTKPAEPNKAGASVTAGRAPRPSKGNVARQTTSP